MAVSIEKSRKGQNNYYQSSWWLTLATDFLTLPRYPPHSMLWRRLFWTDNYYISSLSWVALFWKIAENQPRLLWRGPETWNVDESAADNARNFSPFADTKQWSHTENISFFNFLFFNEYKSFFTWFTFFNFPTFLHTINNRRLNAKGSVKRRWNYAFMLFI